MEKSYKHYYPCLALKEKNALLPGLLLLFITYDFVTDFFVIVWKPNSKSNITTNVKIKDDS
jgi:hypothetical protein